MATDTSPRRFSWAGFGIAIVIAGVLGVAVPYALSSFSSDTTSAKPAPKAAATPPPPPPKMDYLGAAKMSGSVASLASDPSKTADLASDDAMVVWLKAVPAAGAAAPAPAGGAAPAAAGGGGGRAGGRGPRLPLAVKDEAGEDYAFSVERKEDNIYALHIKKGYSKKPATLTISEMKGKDVVDKWDVKDVPAPVVVLPDDSLKGAPLGEIQLKPGRGGRLGASVHLTMALPKNQGVILKPIAASYLQIDSSRPGSILISKQGESPYDGRLAVPNAQMARRVSFDMQTYEAVTTTETVTFHNARLEDRSGQPTLVVENAENATSPSGIKVQLPKQDWGPKRPPRHPKPEITLQITYDPPAVSGGGLVEIAPVLIAELTDPPLASLGLDRIKFTFVANQAAGGADVLLSPTSAPLKGAAGTFKYGPIANLTLKLTIVKPKILSTKRIVLPVNPKVFPPDPAGGGLGGPAVAPAPSKA